MPDFSVNSDAARECRAASVTFTLELMDLAAVRASLVAELKSALNAALAGTLFAAWVPPVLFASYVAASAVIDGRMIPVQFLEDVGRSAFAVLALGGLAFLIGGICLVMLGFPALLLLWLLRLRHPIFASAAAIAFVSVGRLEHDDLPVFLSVAAVTGYVAGAYARRGGSARMPNFSERHHEL